MLLIWALFALSLGLMWGYAGLLSFGHSAYFGLGAYTYAIAVINIGESTAPLLLAIAVPAVVAAVIGAMMFYGRISDVYMGVITLVVTLILFKFMSATAGDQYAIGAARLGGFNGIPGFAVINVPGMPEVSLFGVPMYYIAAVSLLGCYLISRWILARSFGRVLVGIRENEARCELLGYSVPAYKTAIFTISAAMAGLAGCLFANWTEIVTPGVFSLRSAAEVIIWTIVGGAGHADRAHSRRHGAGHGQAAARRADLHRQLPAIGLHAGGRRARDPARRGAGSAGLVARADALPRAACRAPAREAASKRRPHAESAAPNVAASRTEAASPARRAPPTPQAGRT